jgi:hypothetical protein
MKMMRMIAGGPSRVVPHALVCVACGVSGTAAVGSVTHFTDEASWRVAAGVVTTVGVPDILPGYQPEAYAQTGLALATVSGYTIPSGAEDVAYALGVPTGTTVFTKTGDSIFRFASPVTAFAQQWLYYQPQVVHLYREGTLRESFLWSPSPPDPWPASKFYGFTSTESFDLVYSFSISTGTHYGTQIMFSQVVPTPGVVAMIAIGMTIRGRPLRRRS